MELSIARDDFSRRCIPMTMACSNFSGSSCRATLSLESSHVDFPSNINLRMIDATSPAIDVEKAVFNPSSIFGILSLIFDTSNSSRPRYTPTKVPNIPNETTMFGRRDINLFVLFLANRKMIPSSRRLPMITRIDIVTL